MTAAARLPARKLPANSQFDLPRAIGRIPPIGPTGLGTGAQAVVAVFDALGLAACMDIGAGEGLFGAQQAARVPFEVHAA